MIQIIQFIAILAVTFFAGAAIYINVAEHPARMECGTAVAAAVFGPSYRRASVMQVVLALSATVTAIGAWFAGAPIAWLVGAILIFSVIPFTLVAIMPTNKPLLDRSTELTSEEVDRLLQRWGKLHAVRSILALAGSVVLLGSLIFQ